MTRTIVHYVPSLILEELSPPRRKIILTGRALPTGELSFGVTQRADVYYAQGNPEGVLTLFGAEEDDTPCAGYWRSKYLGGAVTVVSEQGESLVTNPQTAPATMGTEKLDSTEKLIAIFEEIARTGVLLKVTWAAKARVGIIDKFKCSYRTHEDASWDANFKWIGRDDPRVSAAFTPQYADRGFARSLSDRINALSRALTTPFRAEQTLLDRWNNSLNDVQRVYNTFRDVVDNYSDGVTAPFAAARSTVDLMRRMVAGLESVADDIATQSVESLCGVLESLDAAAGLSNADKVRAAVWQGSTVHSFGNVSADIMRALLTAEARIQEGEDTTYIANRGDTLRSIAELYYDNADQWRSLATYNNLSASTLSQGQVIRVPQRLP